MGILYISHRGQQCICLLCLFDSFSVSLCLFFIVFTKNTLVLFCISVAMTLFEAYMYVYYGYIIRTGFCLYVCYSIRVFFSSSLYRFFFINRFANCARIKK